MKILKKVFAGDGIGARSKQSAAWSFAEFSGGQTLRFLSNLVLTRLLFPEAFGIMALVTVITVGLTLFSDTGIKNSIIQNDRGDEEDFLNTAWTIQVIRGIFLWFLVLVLAQPIANIYNEPLLAKVLPIAALSLIAQGFQPTSVHTANRHLKLGAFTKITLGAQFVTLVITAILALKLGSIWALVFGTVIGATITTIWYHISMPGPSNSFRLEMHAFWSIFHYGKWIFLSSSADFVRSQGDRAILGLFISFELLGIYSIAYFIGILPVTLYQIIQGRVIVPLYRLKNPLISAKNRADIFWARRLASFAAIVLAIFLAGLAPFLVDVLYDDRYSLAGPIITVLSLSIVPMIGMNNVTHALLGLGESRAAFLVTITTAVVQLVFLIFLIYVFGLVGALIAPGLSIIISYPLRLYFSMKFKIFDPLQDLGFTALGVILVGLACNFHWDTVSFLFN